MGACDTRGQGPLAQWLPLPFDTPEGAWPLSQSTWLLTFVLVPQPTFGQQAQTKLQKSKLLGLRETSFLGSEVEEGPWFRQGRILNLPTLPAW